MASGIAKCIADVLRNDTLSGYASSYVATYPQLFNAASAVPSYLYTSLKDIWMANSSASGLNWSNLIQDTYGFGYGGNREISVVTVRTLDIVDSPMDELYKSNTTGCEFAEVFIYFKITGNLSTSDIDRIVQAELRVRRLIDYNYRVNVCNNVEFPITDLTINPTEDVKCYWQGSVANVQGQEKQLAIQYYAGYTRLLLK